MINKLKPLTAALGMSLALASFSASAVINWGPDLTLFEDNDIDFLVETNGNGLLEVGESLIAVVELETANGVTILPQELTGVTAITLVTITDLDGGGVDNDFVFGPGLLGGAGGLFPGLDAGAMIAFWLDDTPNLAISAGNVVGGTVSCTTLAQCIAQASDGALWEVDGFGTGAGADPDDYWVAINAEADTSIVLAGLTSSEFGSINAGLSILFNGTGKTLVEDSLACGIFCAPGGNGFTDMSLGGSIKGGSGLSAGLIGDGAVATSDFDFTKRSTIPEPASLALLGIGLMGLGAMRRTRRS